MAGLHLGSLPVYSSVPRFLTCPEKKRKGKNWHIPSSKLAGQHTARKAHSSGMPPKVCQVGVLPAGRRGWQRVCHGQGLLRSEDIWGTLPLNPEGLQSDVNSSPTSKGLWPLINVKRAVLALAWLKFNTRPFQLVGLYFVVVETEVSYKVFTYLHAGQRDLPCLDLSTIVLKLIRPALELFSALPRNVWNFRHWVKHPYTGTRSEIRLEFIAVYKLIGLPLHFLKAHLSLRKKGIAGHTQDITLFYHVDHTVCIITAFSCSQTYYGSRDLKAEDTESNNRVSLIKLTALPLDIKVVFITVQTIFFCFKIGTTGSQICKAAI